MRYLECKCKQLKQFKIFTIGLWCKTLICKCSKLALTAGNNDDIASPYQELQNVGWAKVMVEIQMCNWLTSLYCEIWCSNVYFPSFLQFFPRTGYHFWQGYHQYERNLFAPVGWCYRSPPLILIITIFGRSLRDCVYLVPREINHIPARSVCPCLLPEEHGRMFHWFCHRLPNANHNTSDYSAC